MAKLKVHELAKELEVQSKDVVAFLQDKGIEKVAASALEDDMADMVRKHFSKSAGQIFSIFSIIFFLYLKFYI